MAQQFSSESLARKSYDALASSSKLTLIYSELVLSTGLVWKYWVTLWVDDRRFSSRQGCPWDIYICPIPIPQQFMPVPSHPITWDVSHGIPIGMTFPWTSLPLAISYNLAIYHHFYFKTHSFTSTYVSFELRCLPHLFSDRTTALIRFLPNWIVVSQYMQKNIHVESLSKRRYDRTI